LDAAQPHPIFNGKGRWSVKPEALRTFGDAA
jgi:hypothetical protein